MFKWIVSLIIFASMSCNAQNYRGSRNNNSFLNNTVGAVGITAGHEYFAGVRFGGYKSFPINSRSRSQKINYGFDQIVYYFGADASILVFFAGWYGISATTGIAIKPFTFDCSLTALHIAGPSSIDQNANQFTINPKIGIQMGPVWLKAGPSFALGESSYPDWFKWGRFNWNIDLLLTVRH